LLFLLTSFSHAQELKVRWSSEFVGSLDGQKNIRLLLYRDREDKIIGSYFNPQKLVRHHLVGSAKGTEIFFEEIENENRVAIFKGTLSKTEDEKIILKGTYTKNDQSLECTLTYNIHFPARPGRNLYAPIEADSTEEVELFAANFKKNLLAGNKAEVIKSLHYKVYVNIDGKDMWVESEDYLKYYDKIFHPKFIEAVKKNSFPMNMVTSYKGVWFGFNRELVIQKTRKGDSPFRLTVAEIHNKIAK
ncbi:MAG: hypothetical protein NE330_20130, partial [Lentisphaeraceae bacterium]|nr:hypothetical protein [Lentisphaeraceae bacterium]